MQVDIFILNTSLTFQYLNYLSELRGLSLPLQSWGEKRKLQNDAIGLFKNLCEG